MRILIWFVMVAAVVMTGCQTTPTEVRESGKREFDLLVDKTQRAIALTDETVVLDARSSFDYGLNHIQNSLHMPWENLAESYASGEVLKDPRKAALKLSLSGLQPATPVVVVGYGPRGKGEEGRLAWTLLYLGFQDVQVGALELFRKNMTPNASPAAKNIPPWPVNPRSELQVGKAEFDKLKSDPKGRLDKRIFIIDVRSAKEYFNREMAKGQPLPDIHALNMEWTEFYNAQGRPNRSVVGKLKSLGIQPTDRVIMISNKGVRSGAAAYALIALGFSRVQNFTGGWNSLLTDRM